MANRTFPSTLSALAALALPFAVAAVAMAQAVPPLPPEKPAARAAGQAGEPAADITAEAPAAAPAPAPAPAESAAPPANLESLREDTALQSRLKDIDAMVQKTWDQVTQAKAAAMRFHLARAELKDIIAKGKCAGVPGVLKRLDVQEGETRKLMGILEEQCARVPAGTQSELATACAAERSKLAEEMAALDGDRATLNGMCPPKAN